MARIEQLPGVNFGVSGSFVDLLKKLNILCGKCNCTVDLPGINFTLHENCDGCLIGLWKFVKDGSAVWINLREGSKKIGIDADISKYLSIDTLRYLMSQRFESNRNVINSLLLIYLNAETTDYFTFNQLIEYKTDHDSDHNGYWDRVVVGVIYKCKWLQLVHLPNFLIYLHTKGGIYERCAYKNTTDLWRAILKS